MQILALPNGWRCWTGIPQASHTSIEFIWFIKKSLIAVTTCWGKFCLWAASKALQRCFSASSCLSYWCFQNRPFAFIKQTLQILTSPNFSGNKEVLPHISHFAIDYLLFNLKEVKIFLIITYFSNYNNTKWKLT